MKPDSMEKNSRSVAVPATLETQCRPGDRRAGQMMIFMTLSLFFLFSVMGLSVDLGYSYFIKVFAQAAADSAALAAGSYAATNGDVCATDIVCNSTYSCPTTLTSASTALQAGCLYAKANGFVNTGNQSVSLFANNTSPPNETIASALWIQANVSQTVPHLFLFLSGFKSGAVATRAVAAVIFSPNSACVYVLSPAGLDALNVTGSASLTTSSCGVNVKSSNTTAAIDVTGSASITATGGGQISVVGKATVTSSASITPTAVAVATVTDPLAGKLTPPTVSTTCGQTNYSLGNSNTASINPSNLPSGTVSAGVYCGGITVTGSAHLTMAPGTYILNGGGFNIGNSGTVTSTGGVTIFLTGQNGYVAAGMQLSGSSTTTLSAPSSGPYQGILFYQDPGVTYGAGNQQGGSAHLSATGTFYFPTTALTLSGSVSASKIAIIAYTLSVTGSATFDEDVSGAYTGLTQTTFGLIE